MNATSTAEAVKQAGWFGTGQLADRQAQDIVVEEAKDIVGFFQAVQGILFGVGDEFEEPADLAG